MAVCRTAGVFLSQLRDGFRMCPCQLLHQALPAVLTLVYGDEAGHTPDHTGKVGVYIALPRLVDDALKKTWWRIAGRLNFLFRRGLGDRCLYRRFRLFCLRRRVVFRCRWLFLLRCRLWLRWWPVRLQAFEDVSSRSLFFFLSSSRIAGRSFFEIEASATICSSVALICPVRISSCAPGTALIYGQWAERSSQTHIVSGNTCRHP